MNADEDEPAAEVVPIRKIDTDRVRALLERVLAEHEEHGYTGVLVVVSSPIQSGSLYEAATDGDAINLLGASVQAQARIARTLNEEDDTDDDHDD